MHPGGGEGDGVTAHQAGGPVLAPQSRRHPVLRSVVLAVAAGFPPGVLAGVLIGRGKAKAQR